MSQAAPDLAQAAQRVAATLLDVARTRFELGLTELAEERLRLSQLLLMATLALFCLGVGIVLAIVALAWWAGPERGALVLGAAAALLLGAALWAWLQWQRVLQQRPDLLQATREQLRADARALGSEP